jgi:protease I
MADKRINGSKILMVIAPEQFRDEELLEPKRIFTEEGAQVTVASTKAGPAKGMLGATATPDCLIKDARPADFDAIVVVGGMGSPEYLWENNELHTILQQAVRDDKVVASICLSGAVLAKAGVLQNKQATVWEMPESLAALQQGKATYKKQPVVQDGRIITANGPEAAAEFGRTVVAELAKTGSIRR